MKIAFISSFANMQSGAASLIRLVENIRAKGHQVILLTTDPEAPALPYLKKINLSPFEKFLNRFNQKTIGRKNPGVRHASYGHLLKKLREFQPEIINVHWIHGHTIPLSLVAKLSREYPLFWTFHDMWPVTGNNPFEDDSSGWQDGYQSLPKKHPTRIAWEAKYRALKDLPISIITPSNWMAEVANKSPIFKKTNVYTVANGLNTDLFRPISQAEKERARSEIGIKPRQIIILFLAAFIDNPRKGYQYFRGALQEMAHDYPELKDKISVIVSGREKRPGKTELPFPTIKINSLLPIEKMRTLYATADIFVLPTEADNLPATAMESLASGTPVVAFGVGGVSDIVKDGQTGLLASPRSAGDLAKKIWLLVNDQDLRSKLSNQCREFFLKNFSEDRQVQKLLNLFLEAIHHSTSKRSEARSMTPKCRICGKDTKLIYDQMFDDRYGYPETYRVNQCLSCKSYLIDPPFHPDKIGGLYSNYYPRSDIDPMTVKKRVLGNKRSNWFSRFATGEHRAQRWFPPAGRPGIRVLDIGCGDGSSLLELQELGYETFGIETDKNVTKVREVLGLKIEIGTIETTNYPEHSFQYIIANQVIEHVTDLKSFMENVSRLLAPGGRVVFSTPNAKSLFRIVYGRRWIHWHIPYHQQIISPIGLKDLLRTHGFKIETIKTVSPTSWTRHEINRLRFQAKPGKTNPFWSNQKGDRNNQTRSSLIGKIVRQIMFQSLRLIGYLANLVKSGNCLVVFASK